MGIEGKDKEMLVLGLVLILVGFFFSLCWPLIIVGLILALIGGIRMAQSSPPTAPPYGHTYPPQQYYQQPAAPQYQYPPQYPQQQPPPQYPPQYPPPPTAPVQPQYGPPGVGGPAQSQYGAPAMPEYCQRCGAELSPLGTFCPKCGHGR